MNMMLIFRRNRCAVYRLKGFEDDSQKCCSLCVDVERTFCRHVGSFAVVSVQVWWRRFTDDWADMLKMIHCCFRRICWSRGRYRLNSPLRTIWEQSESVGLRSVDVVPGRQYRNVNGGLHEEAQGEQDEERKEEVQGKEDGQGQEEVGKEPLHGQAEDGFGFVLCIPNTMTDTVQVHEWYRHWTVINANSHVQQEEILYLMNCLRSADQDSDTTSDILRVIRFLYSGWNFAHFVWSFWLVNKVGPSTPTPFSWSSRIQYCCGSSLSYARFLIIGQYLSKLSHPDQICLNPNLPHYEFSFNRR